MSVVFPTSELKPLMATTAGRFIIFFNYSKLGLTPRSGWKHKAWGVAKRNPRITTGKENRAREACDSAKEAIYSRLTAVAHFVGSSSFCLNDPWVSLRSTPGFILCRASRAQCKLFTNLFRDSERLWHFRSSESITIAAWL